MIGAGNDKQFRILSSILGHPEWADDAKFLTNSQRVVNRQEMITLITTALAPHPTTYWLDHLHGKGLPYAPINNIEDTFKHPQAVAREVTVEVEHARAGKVKLLAPAIRYNGAKMKVERAPPVLGQDTSAILREELGYDDQKILQLRKRGVV